MKRVLVTGGSGFVGRHCLPQLLERGYEVHAVSSRRQADDHVKWHMVNLKDQPSVASLMKSLQPTHLLHLAWITEPRDYSTTVENFIWLVSSMQLLRSFHEHGGQRVVMTGSCAEYDWNYGTCREDLTPLKPATRYGQCKAALRTNLERLATQVGLSWAWGRLFFMYGPYAHPSRLPGVVIESLLRNEPARCSHGNQIRDFLHVADAAAGLVTLIDSDVQGTVNVASGEPVAIREIVLHIADHFGRRDLVEFGAIPTAATDPPLLVADVSRLKMELGWKAAYSLASGLDATIEWHKGGSRGKAI